MRGSSDESVKNPPRGQKTGRRTDGAKEPSSSWRGRAVAADAQKAKLKASLQRRIKNRSKVIPVYICCLVISCLPAMAKSVEMHVKRMNAFADRSKIEIDYRYRAILLPATIIIKTLSHAFRVW